MPAWTPAPPIILRRELLVKRALGQPGTLHQVLQADAVEAVLPERRLATLITVFAVFRGLECELTRIVDLHF